jgi:hypothetical protein
MHKKLIVLDILIYDVGGLYKWKYLTSTLSLIIWRKRWGTRQANEIFKESSVGNAKAKGKTE